MRSRLVEYHCSNGLLTDTRVSRATDGLLRYRQLDPSLSELLDVAVHRFAGRTAVEEVHGEQVTYAELWAEASRVAGGLKSRGIEIGDRVAIRFAAGVRWLEACLGVILAGGVPVSLGMAWGDAEVSAVIADSGSVLVLDGELPHGVPFIDDGAAPDELAVLAYTADPSGAMLGVELSNENVLSTIEGLLHSRDYGVEGVRNLLVDSDFRSVRELVHVLATLVIGGTVVVAGDFWRESAHTVDILTGRPEDLLEPRLLAVGPAARAASRSVKWVDCSGSPVTAEQEDKLLAAFPAAQHVMGWGKTETCGGGLILPIESASTHLGSVGIAFGGMEVALYGPDAPGGYGELWCRGPSVARRYWNSPEVTSSRFMQGWFCTHDTAQIDAEGFVRIVERNAA
ncbi:CoA synthetase [Rhodococcus sp. AD45-ID]|jgi:long-chain acyl-CoA synthetase|uniref:Acyl-CoA synthetase (AMP-forming)/AMP-acid ligase II n=2 Tax=Nocardiaceae TaxID=85025 RepID=A0A652YH76_NOCGL|nr:MULTISPECIES: AMP-binding protein [Rhodococcus]NMD64372.1 long-chain fatty acid--CoA ligase [Nocardia globerula]KJF21651.1 Long-chain-fatty-acid--CoA ligase [Rhodococcus sp. AD45]MCE4263328.1 long-chain fatty acid--CoA ligase [Rhodococcus globerulus]MDV6270443.1 AMP-binding protein [Rhodococcus globerulus]NRI69102.1 long-chain fatty acid--CoA ligase [Rhodococcus sp. MS16]